MNPPMCCTSRIFIRCFATVFIAMVATLCRGEATSGFLFVAEVVGANSKDRAQSLYLICPGQLETAKQLNADGEAVWDLIWDPLISQPAYRQNGVPPWKTIDLGTGIRADYKPRGTFTDHFAYSNDGQLSAGASGPALMIYDRTSLNEGLAVKGQVANRYFSPSWAPSNEEIAFVGSINGNDNNKEIFIVKRDGAGLRQLTDFPWRVNWWGRLWLSDAQKDAGYPRHSTSSPQWSPDGKWILFTTKENLYLTRPDGTEQHPIAANAGAAAWDSTSKYIAYPRRSDSYTIVYRNNPDGNDEKEIFRFNNIWIHKLIWLPFCPSVAWVDSTHELQK